MLSISIIGTIVIGLAILALVGMFLYWGNKGPDDENLTDDDNDPFEDSELIYGAAIQVDKKFANAHGLRTGEYYFITLPSIDTPVDHVRVTTNNGDLDVPRHRIKSIVYDIETGGVDSYKKKYPSGNSVSQRNSDPFSQALLAEIAFNKVSDQSYEGSNVDFHHPDEAVIMGNGGKFAGGGASGSWEEGEVSGMSNTYAPFSDSDHNREMRGLSESRTEITFNSIFNDDHRSSSVDSSPSSDSGSYSDSGSSGSDD